MPEPALQDPSKLPRGDFAAAQARALEGLREANARARAAGHASRAHAEVSDLLGTLGRRQEAQLSLRAAAALPTGRAEDYEALAFSAFGLGDHELSRDFYARVVELAPRDGLAWYNLATAERNLGRLQAAEEACNRALSLDERLVQAALLRAHLKTQTPDDNHIDDLRRRLSSCDWAGRIFLSYALGKELDDIAEFEAAFRCFQEGARARRETLRYDVAEDVWKLARIREAFDTARLRAAPPRDPSSDYGFIIGLPRSGTTMIERVLTGHPDVASNGETDNLVAALMEGASGAGADVFERVAQADPRVVGEAYRRRAGGLGRRLVLEKLPLNYLYAGAIALTLPGARMVLVTRSAADNAFAMYSTLFGNGYPFSYDLDELAAYYLAYRELLEHWRANLGSSLLELRYEDFVESPAEQGAQLAEFLGLDWRPEMTRIEDNRSASATASAAQVRRPIYKSAIGRWRNYAAQLQPLIARLHAEGVNLEAERPADR